jgi:hypothetical protein
MLHVGLDLSRRRLDVCVLSDEGELVEELAAPPARGSRSRTSQALSARADRLPPPATPGRE